MRRDDIKLDRLADAIDVPFDGIDMELISMYQDILVVSWVNMYYEPTTYTFIQQKDGSWYYAKDWNASDGYESRIGFNMVDILNKS